jgi:thiamine-phosphate pyrophosphorylase
LSKTLKNRAVYRIIDANTNRLKEGLRVCEEICRFALNSGSLTKGFKDTRHNVRGILKTLPESDSFIEDRDISGDTGKQIHHTQELKRKDCRDIFSANIQRVKESLRVLEEFSKLSSAKAALGFKKERYRVYELEKKVTQRLAPLRNHR